MGLETISWISLVVSKEKKNFSLLLPLNTTNRICKHRRYYPGLVAKRPWFILDPAVVQLCDLGQSIQSLCLTFSLIKMDTEHSRTSPMYEQSTMGSQGSKEVPPGEVKEGFRDEMTFGLALEGEGELCQLKKTGTGLWDRRRCGDCVVTTKSYLQRKSQKGIESWCIQGSGKIRE